MSGILKFDPKASKTFKNKKKIGYKLNVEPENNTKLMTSIKKNITTKDMNDPNVFEYDIEELIRDDMLKEERENEILQNLRKRQLKQ
ncbi:uncharacterized protein HGUI_00596 [Hanseniaspora guilliermondii]|uniref:Uncharacterized protein n=1 Tax=Hanseniaspora guilliermondii TaxID=56406 RepID=A0A1L0AXW2_9ASCO|nr:uncharacterized protein HGUI_00596 [Hanseniaspora guilliermondii]